MSSSALNNSESLSVDEREQRRIKALDRFENPQEEVKIIPQNIPKPEKIQLSAEEIRRREEIAKKREEALRNNQMELDTIVLPPAYNEPIQYDPVKRQKCLSGRNFIPQEIKIPSISINLQLEKLINDPSSDFFLIAGDGTRIGVHKVILCTRSLVFDTIINSQSSEAFTGIYTIPDFSSKALAQMIQFIYAGQVKTNNIDIVELLYLSDLFKLDNLKICIEQHLETFIDVDNLITLLEISEELKLDSLNRQCWKFCIKNNEVKKVVGQMSKEMKAHYFKIHRNK